MRASVSEQRGEGNQSGPGLVFCVFIGKRAGQNRRAEVKFAAFGGAPPRGGNSCLSVQHAKEKGANCRPRYLETIRLLPLLKKLRDSFE